MQQLEAPPNYRAYEPGRAAGRRPRPEPLIGQIGRTPYPVDALPMAIRRAVEEVQACVQAPVEMVASSALATASLAAQALADVRRNRTLIGPIGLYFLTVAESGERKSTVDRLFGRAVYDFQDRQREAARSSLAAHAGPTWRRGKPGARPRSPTCRATPRPTSRSTAIAPTSRSSRPASPSRRGCRACSMPT